MRPMTGKAAQFAGAVPVAAIPYRTGASVSMGSLAVAGLVMILALAVLVAVLVHLRRRGWAGGWLADKRTGREQSIELRSSRRLGMSATAHVIAYQGAEYLVVENGRGSTATVLKLDAPRADVEGTA